MLEAACLSDHGVQVFELHQWLGLFPVQLISCFVNTCSCTGLPLASFNTCTKTACEESVTPSKNNTFLFPH